MCAKAIYIELEKLKLHNCLIITIFNGRYLVPMKCIFSIKTDGSFKARLVDRGDPMFPLIDFDPKEIYCGNISACRIKLVLAIVSSYKLRVRGGDLVGAYLVSNKSKQALPSVHQDPQRYRGTTWHVYTSSGQYGFPPAGKNYEFDACVKKMGYHNTPWDLKLFYKWVHGKPVFVIAHSDDFRLFGSEDAMFE